MVSKQSFLKGAVILAVAGALSKVLGALYRIPLARLLGGEGMGLYQMAYPIYTTILSLATAGVPVAISVLVARKESQGLKGDSRRMLSVSLVALAVAGLLLSALVYWGANFFAVSVLKEPRAALPIAAIAPAIFFAGIMSVFRGYFQGHQWMIPTAVSQVIEQVFRVTFVLILAIYLLPRGLTYAAAGATFGAVVGGIAGIIVLFGFYFWFRHNESRTAGRLLTSSDSSAKLASDMMKLAIPVSLGSVVVPLVQMLDAIIVPGRLMSIGMTTGQATEMYGWLSGMASVLINLPTIFTISIATSLVPVISEAVALNRRHDLADRINNGLRIGMMIALPSAAGLYILAYQITDLLFAVPEAGRALAPLSFSVIVLAAFQISSAALQGIGRADLPFRHLVITGVLKVIFNYTLTGIPALNLVGPCIGTVVSFFIGSALNFYYLGRLTGLKVEWLRLTKIALSATVMAAVVHYAYEIIVFNGVDSHLATAAGIIVGGAVYPVFLYLLGELDKDLIARFIKPKNKG